MQTLAARVAHLEDLVSNVVRLHRKEVAQRYGIGLATLHRWLHKGILPPPIRLAGPLWRLPDLEAAERAGQLPRPVSA